MATNLTKVKDFHVKHGFPVQEYPTMKIALDPEIAYQSSSALRDAGAILVKMSKVFENGTFDGRPASEGYDDRLLRAHLLIEELGELCNALADEDHVGVLDGLADIEYVTHGAALTFGLPLQAAFDEVHKSNMTKSVGAGGDKDVRCRKKGDTYVPPNIKGILDGVVNGHEGK